MNLSIPPYNASPSAHLVARGGPKFSLRSFLDAKKQLEISRARKDCKIWLWEDMRVKGVTYAEEHGVINRKREVVLVWVFL